MNVDMMKSLYDIDYKSYSFSDGTILHKFINPLNKEKKHDQFTGLLLYIKPESLTLRLTQTRYVEGRRIKDKGFRKIDKFFIIKYSIFNCISFKKDRVAYYHLRRAKKRSKHYKILNFKNRLDSFKNHLKDDIHALYGTESMYDYNTQTIKISPKTIVIKKFIENQIKQKFEKHNKLERYENFTKGVY